MRKRLLILLVALVSSFNGLAQKSQEEIYNLVTRSTNYSYDELLDFVDNKLSDKEDIARFFYYWIGKNIKYDLTVDAFELNQPHYTRKTEPQFVFTSRKATCIGYNNLYDSFLSYFGIIHKTILGYTRHRSNILRNIAPTVDHVWSAIYINDQWHLADVTWAFTHIEKPDSRDHYFMTPPQAFKNDHLPLDEEWFLDGQRLQLEDFHKQPLISPDYFGFTGKTNLKVTMELNDEGETLLYFPVLNGWRFNLKAVNEKDEIIKRLKYKMKRTGAGIQFTLKNYEPGMTLRLDATRKEFNGLYYSSYGLVYISHTDWQQANSAAFRQFSTKQYRFKK